MKKAITLLLALALLPGMAFAAGSSPATQYMLSADKNQLVIKLACVGDADNGSIPAKTINEAAISAGLPKEYQAMGFYLTGVHVVVGTTAPDAADIAITDALGVTLYSQASIIPTSGTAKGTVPKAEPVNSVLTVTVANQATASATYDIYIKLGR
ncbi:MAG TPA: hypothetical protein DCZ95_18185 [Verrucomicrobia bacterium]|nr:hypothetical protein [Verrucomicrobiota bacterium]